MDHIFAVGSFAPNNNKAELYNFSDGSWRTTADYPYAKSVRLAPVVHFDSAFYVFGGFSGSVLGVIGRFDSKSEVWHEVGSLNQPRYGHGAIQSENRKFLIVLF